MTDAMQLITQRCPTSLERFEHGKGLLPTEVVSTVAMPIPFYVREAKGARVIDVDGNEYIDLTMGFGPHVLGHSPDVVIDAVREAAGRGLQWGLAALEQQDLAALLIDAAPCAERAAFFNSGTEATMIATRVARAFTGRSKIAVFDGSYNGSQDQMMVLTNPSSPREHPAPVPFGAGIDHGVLDKLVFLPYREDAAFDLIREQAADLAAVFIEPVQSSNPRTDCGDFLQKLRDVCTETGVLLIFDEVITGFRLAFGGGQELFGVVPDLATYGKALGGGLPIGAVAGRADVMKTLTLEFGTRSDPPRIFSGGTFAGNPVTMVAGIAQLTYLRDHPDVYKHLDVQGNRLANEINDYCLANDYPAQIMNANSMLYLQLQSGEIRSARDKDHSPRSDLLANALFLELLCRGVVVPGVHLSFVSAAHTSDDVDTVIDAIRSSLDALRDKGLC